MAAYIKVSRQEQTPQMMIEWYNTYKEAWLSSEKSMEHDRHSNLIKDRHSREVNKKVKGESVCYRSWNLNIFSIENLSILYLKEGRSNTFRITAETNLICLFNGKLLIIECHETKYVCTCQSRCHKWHLEWQLMHRCVGYYEEWQKWLAEAEAEIREDQWK